MKYPRGILKQDSSVKKEEIVINEWDIVRPIVHGNTFSTRASGNFKNLGYFLTDTCDWQIIRDDMDCPVLVPIKKGGE